MEKITNTNKLIIGAVVVLAAFYLYDRNKKMKAAAEAEAQAQAEAEAKAERGKMEKALSTKRPLNQMNNSLFASEEII